MIQQKGGVTGNLGSSFDPVERRGLRGTFVIHLIQQKGGVTGNLGSPWVMRNLDYPFDPAERRGYGEPWFFI